MDIEKIGKDIMGHSPMVTGIAVPASMYADILRLVPEVVPSDSPIVSRWHGVNITPNQFLTKHIVLFRGDEVVGIIEIEWSI